MNTIETDWLIVGGGSAGCVLAARLSEDPAKQVLLVEAGPDWRAADAPVQLRSVNGWRALDGTLGPMYQWEGVASLRCAGQELRPHLRGRGLGGSSTVNGMIAFRQPPADYDRWAAAGCTGWGYDDVLPYLRRMERDFDFGSSPHHGDAGPIAVRRMPRETWGPLDNALAAAGAELGYGWSEDHNGPGGTGLSPLAFNADEHGRVTTNDGYLEPARGRANLRIIGGVTVDRVLTSGGCAVGVRARIGGEWTEIRAEGVVLCAGAIGSPAILLRSGVGPDGPVAALPVGEGMQEHPLAVFWAFPRPEAAPGLDDRHTNCCLRYSSELGGAAANDMVMVSVNQTLALPEAVASHLALESGTWAGAAGGSTVGGPGLLCMWANEEHSRGTLRLASPDPDLAPDIDQNLLGVQSDLERMRDAVKRGLELVRTGEFERAFAHLALDPTGTPLATLTDEAAIDAWLRATVGDTGHVCGTCRMGAPDDERTVVDPHGRVLGLERLWVADASVFPDVPRANTNLPTIAVAERLSDLIATELASLTRAGGEPVPA